MMRLFTDPMMPPHDRKGPARPAPPEAIRLADAMVALDRAAAALEQAKDSFPGYPAGLSREDYCAAEQDAYNRAAEAFADAVLVVVARGGAHG
jgi:hypothetical protein